MGITGLLPFIEKASRRTNISEFNGCTVAIDSYCWLHKGAFACADKLVRGEETDIHIKYCLKYVNMLLSKNVKPVLVFDGRHLPAKAMTESKRRESRNISKKRAAELLSLGKMEEARSYMRRSVDITHEMALTLIKECRKRNIDCIVAPYEADSQLAYMNIKNIAHVVITEDSDLILFGCTKVLFKMDLDGTGTLVETAKLPLVMKCPIEHYSFDKFRQMCVMSGCDYLASLPGIGLAKARQFVTATQDTNFANALRKLPSFFNRANLTVTDEYRENFLKAEATFKHQYVYDPLERQMVRLTEPDDEDIEKALCVNAGEMLDPKIAFQLALGNLDPFSLKKMDDWHPDYRPAEKVNIKTSNWKDEGIAKHPSIWSADFRQYIDEPCPWQKKKQQSVNAFSHVRPRRRMVNLVSKVVPETEDQDESLTIQSLSNMYCIEPSTKRLKTDIECEMKHNGLADEETRREITKEKSPILENKERSFKKRLENGSYSILKRLSRFPRTIIDTNVVESKFFSTSTGHEATSESIVIGESIKCTDRDIVIIDDFTERKNVKREIQNDIIDAHGKSKNPFKISIENCTESENVVKEDSTAKSKNPFKKSIDSDDTLCSDFDSSQKENSPCNSPIKIISLMKENSPKKVNSPMKANSPILQSPRNHVMKRLEQSYSEDTVIENTYPMETLVTPVDSQESFGCSQQNSAFWDQFQYGQPNQCQPKKIHSQPNNLHSQPNKLHSQPNNLYSQPNKLHSQPNKLHSQPNKLHSQPNRTEQVKKSNCRVPGLRRTASLPTNQPTLISKFGFQKKPALKR